MRTLKTEELNLVAGAGCDDGGTKDKCNNGWGNGESCSPGHSGENADVNKFDDPNTGATPSKSPCSGGGDR